MKSETDIYSIRIVRIKFSFAGLIANLITGSKVLGHEIENP